MFISGETSGIANSTKAPWTLRAPLVSGVGLAPITSLPLNSPAMLVKVIVPSSRSIVSGRVTIPANDRLGFEMQNWHSDNLAGNTNTDSIGFVGPSVQFGASW